MAFEYSNAWSRFRFRFRFRFELLLAFEHNNAWSRFRFGFRFRFRLLLLRNTLQAPLIEHTDRTSAPGSDL